MFDEKQIVEYINLSIITSPIEGLDFSNDVFRNVGCKKIVFRHCVFSFCIFEDVYFRGATFEECSFIGARFRGCNFYGASLSKCKFDYSFFSSTEIESSQIIDNFPTFPNVRALLLRSLRANAESIGRSVDISIYFDRELEATREYLKGASAGTTQYYAGKYKGLDRWRMCARLFAHDISGFWWGHGESIGKLARTTFLLLLISTGSTIWLGSTKLRGGSPSENFGVVLRHSSSFVVSSFLGNTFGDTQFDGATDRVLCLAATSLGYVTLALFVSVLYKRLVQR